MYGSETDTDLVLLGGRGVSTPIVYHHLAARFPLRYVLIEDKVQQSQLLRRRWRRLGPRKVIGQLMFQAGLVPALKVASRQRIAAIKRSHALDDRPIDAGVVTRVPSVNDTACIELLQRLRPRVVVVNGTRILSAQTLESVEATFINTHSGITPLYRGVHGGYWALVNRNRNACGVTVHLVDTGIDTGGILGMATIDPGPEDNYTTYPYLQLASGLPVLESAIRRALAGDLEVLPPPAGPSRLYSHPTLGEYLWHRARHGIR